MKTCKISEILVENRQRQEIKPKELEELKKGILSKGLIHPPTLESIANVNGSSFRLVAGERRVRAIRELHEEGHQLRFDSAPIPEHEIPFTLVSDLDEADRIELELEENVLRTDLTWLEEAEARNALYELRVSQDPTTTKSSVARELSEKTGAPFKTTNDQISEAIIIAKHKNDPSVQRARNKREALTAILDKSEQIFKANLNSARMLSSGNNDHQIINGDLFSELPNIPDSSVDIVLVDPPYGIAADKMGKGEFHMYDDSRDYALDACKAILTEGFRIAKPKALLYMFCDIEHFVTLREFAKQQAWTPWRAPLVWIKGVDGHAPWGKFGYIRTTELILFCSKGQKELTSPGGPDHFTFKRVARNLRMHSAEKPPELLEYILARSTLTGDTILDPCAGSGSLIPAAKKLGLKTICIEKEPEYYTQILSRLED